MGCFKPMIIKRDVFYPGVSIIEMKMLDDAVYIGMKHAEKDNHFCLFLFSVCNLHFVMICIFSDIFINAQKKNLNVKINLLIFISCQ